MHGDIRTAATLANAIKRAKEIEEAKRLEDSFYEFVKAAWHVFDPSDFVGNWHLEDLCAHLEEVARGHINRLLINVPPRTSKSNISSICFPAWVWAQRERGPLMGPQVSFFYASYAEQLSLEHSLKCRRLIESRWYQKYWGSRFKMVSDRNQKGHFENDKGGYRMASSVDAKATGFGADCLFADDPHLVKEAESDVVREGVVRWWSETMRSRFNNPNTGAMVVVMQRVHEGDLAGDILMKDDELRKKGRLPSYVHLCSPMCYVPCQHVNAWVGNRIVTFIGDQIQDVDPDDVFWEDRRTEDGELLWPERFSANEVALLEHEVGPVAFCTPAESPVLMADLSLKPIGQVSVGDEIVGFVIGDDQHRARLKPAKITAISKSVRPVVKMTLDSGEVIRCTEDHKWFTGRNDWSHPPYKPARVGSVLKRVCPAMLPELDIEDTRLAGWVSGFFDGEGSTSLMHRRSGEEGSVLISFHQTAEQNLPLCEKLEAALNRFGFNWSLYERQPSTLSAAGTPWQKRRYYYLKNEVGRGFNKSGPAKRASKFALNQRFLHIVQPTKWRDRIIQTAANGRMFTGSERVVSIEPDGVETVYGLTTETGNYIVWGLASSNSGQYQQNPMPRGGGIIREEWWQTYDADAAREFGAPLDDDGEPREYPAMEFILASLDTAYTEDEENDPSALSIWGIFRDKGGNPKVMLMYCWEERLIFPDLVRRVGDDCKKWRVDRLIIEDKAAGHSVSQELARLFGQFNFGIELCNPRTGFIKSPDKSARLQTVVHLFAEGLVYTPDKEWADKMIRQCALVPRAIHDDLADTCSMALIWLRRSGWAQRKEEVALAVEDETRYRPRMAALYPV